MGESDERGLHTAIAGFIVWLAQEFAGDPVRHEYPVRVERFLRWRNGQAAEGRPDGAEAFQASLAADGASEHEQAMSAEAVGHFSRYLKQTPG